MAHTHEHNHSHDHGHDHEHENQLVQLLDEEGNETEFEIVISFEHEDVEYAVLYPVDGSTGEEALIFKVTQDGEESIFENLTDEEFDVITDVYYELMNENE